MIKIKTPTIFVLGAGASFDYGFPLGSELRKLIIRNFEPDYPKNLIGLFVGMGFFESDIHDFRDELIGAATTSIDAFLEARQPYERRLGKYAIAAALIPFEDPKKVMNQAKWLENFINTMNLELSDFKKNKWGFITFNYDRSLEYLLHTRIKSLFALSSPDAANLVNQIPIQHVYGSLGKLPWQISQHKEYLREFSTETSAPIIARSAETIDIIHDTVKDELALKKSFLELKNKVTRNGASPRVFFMGFGYNEINMKRIMPSLGGSGLHGTSLGLGDRIKDYMRRTYPNVKLQDEGCEDFITKNYKLFQAPALSTNSYSTFPKVGG